MKETYRCKAAKLQSCSDIGYSACRLYEHGHGVSTTKIGMRLGIGIGIKIINLFFHSLPSALIRSRSTVSNLTHACHVVLGL